MGDFSPETFQAKREEDDRFKIVKGKKCQPIILYPAKVSSFTNGEIKTCLTKQKQRVNAKPVLKMPKGLVWVGKDAN